MAAARVERRLAAILAADIVGYSRLIEQDEAGTLAALSDLRRVVIDPLLAEYRGRIVRMMGDGSIAEFGSVVEAVACAVAIQRRVKEQQSEVPSEQRLVFRIGVNLGDVVIEGEDLLGDGVNIAARLEQICEPGGVMISGAAYDQLQGKLDLPLEPAGEQRLKNIARPIRTYRMRPEGVHTAALPRRWQHRKLVRVAGPVLLIFALATGAWLWLHSEEPTRAEQPSTAVLPFTFNHDVTVPVGESIIIHGVRSPKCGDPAPSWTVATAALPVSSLGTFSDGGIVSRVSSSCGGTVLARAIRFSAAKRGFEAVNIQGDTIRIMVE